MTTGEWVLVGCVLFVVGFAVYRVATDGRFHGTRRVRGAAAGTTPAEPVSTLLAAAGVIGVPG